LRSHRRRKASSSWVSDVGSNIGEVGRFKLEDFETLPRSFFKRNTVTVARDLLGSLMVRVIDSEVLVGRVVEVEAYGGLDDPASHAYRGNRGRASIMFGEVGYAYVYFTYGNHFCINVVAKDEKTPAGAVLFRALEPIVGIDVMMKNRDKRELSSLTNGPGKLTKALNIARGFNGKDLTVWGDLFLARGWLRPDERVCESTRIGIRAATERPWRFYICGNPYVSK